MKKLFTFVVTMLLGATLAFAQTGGDKSTSDTKTVKTATSKKGAAPAKGKKGGKKSKKNSGGTTTPPPK